MIPRILLLLLISATSLFGQELKVEYDKNHDFSNYKTFSFGEGEITTPSDERTIPDATLHKYIKNSIAEELKEKGLKQIDSLGDLKVSYLIGSVEKLDIEQLGPLGMTPGNTSQTWSRDYWQSNLIIDLEDKGRRVWRINSTTSTPSAEAARMIDQVVGNGFKKFSLKPKKKK